MIKINENYLKLQASYLFAEIGKRGAPALAGPQEIRRQGQIQIDTILAQARLDEGIQQLPEQPMRRVGPHRDPARREDELDPAGRAQETGGHERVRRVSDEPIEGLDRGSCVPRVHQCSGQMGPSEGLPIRTGRGYDLATEFSQRSNQGTNQGFDGAL